MRFFRHGPSMNLLFIAAPVFVLPLVPVWTQTVLFREDFAGEQRDRNRWSVASWKLGLSQPGNTPVLADGFARLAFDTAGLKGAASGLVCAAFT